MAYCQSIQGFITFRFIVWSMPEGPLGLPRLTTIPPFSHPTCEEVAMRIDTVADVSDYHEVQEYCVVDFRLEPEPKREIASVIKVKGSTVEKMTLRFPALSRGIESDSVDLAPDGSNFRNSHAVRRGYCNPHLEIDGEAGLGRVVGWIRSATELYTDTYPPEDRVREEDM